jgi:quercetin dioxygenase-like cupin family protein
MMTEPQAHLYRWLDLDNDQLSPTISRRMIMADGVTLAQFELAAGAIVARHVHEHEQLAYIESGLLRLWLGEDDSQTHNVGAGEVLHIPSNLPHRAEAIETTRATDVFCPRREDWLEGTDAYLRGK